MTTDTIIDTSPIAEAEIGDIVEIHGIRLHVISKLQGQGVTVQSHDGAERYHMGWLTPCVITGLRWLD